MKQPFIIILFLLISVHTFCSAQELSIAPDLEAAVNRAGKTMTVEQPYLQDPVALNAELIYGKDGKQFAVVMKVRVLPGWHIYAYVPETQPYIQTEIKLILPEGVTQLGDWLKPPAYPSSDGVFVYDGDLIFTRYFSVEKMEKNRELQVGLFYQTCDLRQCLPPDTKMKKLLI